MENYQLVNFFYRFFSSPFVIFLHFLSAYLVVFKKKKLNLGDKIIFAFWCSCGFNIIFYYISIVSFFIFNAPFSFIRIFLLFQYFFSIFLNPFLFFSYLLFKLPYSKKIKLVSFFIFLAVLVFSFSFIIKAAKVEIKNQEPILIFPKLRVLTYILASFLLVFFYFFLKIIFLDVKNKIISWQNIRPLYFYYSLIVYGAIAMIQIFYFLPGFVQIIIFFTYFLIPYLIYLSRKDEIAQN